VRVHGGSRVGAVSVNPRAGVPVYPRARMGAVGVHSRSAMGRVPVHACPCVNINPAS